MDCACGMALLEGLSPPLPGLLSTVETEACPGSLLCNPLGPGCVSSRTPSRIAAAWDGGLGHISGASPHLLPKPRSGWLWSMYPCHQHLPNTQQVWSQSLGVPTAWQPLAPIALDPCEGNCFPPGLSFPANAHITGVWQPLVITVFSALGVTQMKEAWGGQAVIKVNYHCCYY